MLTYLTAGESHGPQLTAIIDGLPAGLPVDIDRIDNQLARRQRGYGRGGRMKIEHDRVRVTSGLRGGLTMGGPVTFVIENKDWQNWVRIMDPLLPVENDLPIKEKRLAEKTSTPRPGHADLAGGIKWHHHDLRNVLERASARETAARVAVGSVARQLLERFDIMIVSHVVQIGAAILDTKYRNGVFENLEKIESESEKSEVRCIDVKSSDRMIKAIRDAKKKRDSLGGVAEIIIGGLPAGLGGMSQWYDRLDGRLAGALMSIQSVKGVEIGKGFASAGISGSQFHDEIFYDEKGEARKKRFYRKTNNAGGLEGGMTNGENIILRVTAKPISTLNQPLKTVDVNTKKPAEAMVERTDNCIIPALAVICESVASWVLCQAFLDKFGSDNLAETERNFSSWLDNEY